MNSVKNGSRLVSTRKKSIPTISTHPGNKIAKKRNVKDRHLQLAYTEEFFLLKDISANSNENLATLLGTTTRTIQNKKNNAEPFDISQTERLRKLTKLFKEGNETFGNKDEFNKWMQAPSYGLDYAIPYELLKKPGGMDKIIDELNAIKFGDTI